MVVSVAGLTGEPEVSRPSIVLSWAEPLKCCWGLIEVEMTVVRSYGGQNEGPICEVVMEEQYFEL